ncbi:MAG TPA: hypothetical protein VNU70_02010 [Puia sp.]|jgi:hypothetical protein|nr:hypothetical protein [Puia sp.]
MSTGHHIRNHASPHIRYLKRTDIDIPRWDACISRAPDGLIYGRSFFLDAMTGGRWDGLVLDDYSAVMPLTWKKKFGIAYLYQPHYCAALGIFGQIPHRIHSDFLTAIPRRIRFWDIDLQENNSSISSTALPLKKTMRRNYFLPLDMAYDAIAAKYRRLARRMLLKAASAQLSVERDVDPGLVIENYRKSYGHLQLSGLRQLSDCASKALAEGHAATYLAKGPDREIVGFYLVFSDDRFVYSVLGGSTGKGKEEGAFYLLTDAVIRDHCSSGRIFRFEGSDLPGIAFFNAQFGPYPVLYPHLVLNRLPFPFSRLKPG